MREIKFRAWDEEKHKMFQVDAVFIAGCYSHRFSEFEETEGTSIGPGDHGEREIWESSNILMQYTGLTDKNGKEIYEGDVVKKLSAKGIRIGEIRFHHGAFVVIYPNIKSWKLASERGQQAIEVIGNIYENPELLK